MENLDKELIVRYLSGATDSTENDAIHAWVAASAENRRFMEECFFIWQASKSLHVLETVDTNRALSSLKSKIRKKEKQTRFKHYFEWTQKVAATLLVPALLLSYFLYQSKADEVIPHLEVRTNPGVITSVLLPDSTRVWMNACSYLRYPAQFEGDKREVTLEGEGYFDVMKNQEAPFYVKTRDDYSVKVLGTEFNVKAYSDERRIETTLVEGAVNLLYDVSDKKQIHYKLHPNQKGTFEDGRLTVQTVDPIYEMGWVEGKMYFKNQPMEEVIKRLSRHYNATFIVNSPKVLESLITAKFETEQLLQVLEYIKLASGIKYIVHESNIEGERLTKMTIELTK